MNARHLPIFAVLGLLLIALAATAARTGAAGPSAAGPPQMPTVVTLPEKALDGPGILRRDVSTLPPLANAQMEIVQGTRGDDGTCRYQVAFSAPKGDNRAQMARQIAVDPATCRFQIERGNPTKLPQLPAPNAVSETTGGK